MATMSVGVGLEVTPALEAIGNLLPLDTLRVSNKSGGGSEVIASGLHAAVEFRNVRKAWVSSYLFPPP
jgi:hypothetical protein